MKIAVTGTIGSGKSTLCKKLGELLPEFTIISVDDVVRSIYEDTDFLMQLQLKLDVSTREAASDLVFSDAIKRKKLEALSRPYIETKLTECLSADNIIVEFPLLFEMSNFTTMVDLIISVGCDDAIQTQRVMSRDNMSLAKIQAIRAAQFSRELRAALADIYVDTGLPELAQENTRTEIVARVRMHQLRMSALTLFGDAGDAIWSIIEDCYTEPQRHYHTLWHLHELLTTLKPHLIGHPYSGAVLLAVWFHDLVYETDTVNYEKNEAASAKAMVYIISMHLPEWMNTNCSMREQVYLAAEIIVATKSHRITADWVKANDEMLHAATLFMDADMSIFSAGLGRLAQYDSQIAGEWGQRSGQETFAFCTGRLDALRAFKAASPVFLTQEFHELESTAQANIDHLIDFWQQRVVMHNHSMVGVAQ